MDWSRNSKAQCKGSKDHELAPEKYRDLIRKRGPQSSIETTRETAEAVRSCMEKSRR